MSKNSDLVVWFSDVDKEDVSLVGGKGANLGEMVKANFPVPDGFIVTANAYYQFLKENNLVAKINSLLKSVNYQKQESLEKASSRIKKIINEGRISEALAKEVFAAYKKLGDIFKDALVAVRSSATAEDLPSASFAGQQETFLNVQGEANLLLKIKAAWASLFTQRAIYYRHEQHFNHFKIGIAVPVQKMVESEKSGVMFTIDPTTNDKTKIIIEAIYGLGELIVQGLETPDHYGVSKKTLSIISKSLSSQNYLLKKIGVENKKIKVPKSLKDKQKIKDAHIEKLAKIGKELERHYYFPQDIEWAIERDKIYIVQTRPVTTIQNQKSSIRQAQDKNQKLEDGLKLLLTGDSASPGIATGHVRIIHSAKEISKILPGEVLVAKQTNPDFVPAMKKAYAIVTDSGGRTSHAAIVSRELGIPAIVGVKNATKILKAGQVVTVDAMRGKIYQGGHINSSKFIPIQSGQNSKLEEYIKTATKVYVNLAEPELAEKTAKLGADGVGLLRAEFMIAGIGIHPKKLIRDGKKHLFVNKMVENLSVFCKAFSPRPIVYRASDFKTNEYRQLLGGRDFEPQESNPMLGYRGAFRYINDPQVFKLELEAIKTVREKMGFKNLWLMLPFVRTVKELILVKKIISSFGLYRSETFKLWLMVEIPSNVLLLEKFLWVGIDGVSIGSNDLTMLILGVDRDNSEVAREFDEQNEAVLWALEKIIKTASKHHVTSSICGQAPSLYPNLLEKLVKWGITSVSVSPDALDATRKSIAQFERKIIT